MTALGNAYDHCADAKEASVGGRACEDMAMSRPDSTAASMSAEASTSSELSIAALQEEVVAKDALLNASTRLWALMQSSPSKSHCDASFLVGSKEIFVHSSVVLAWSRPLHSQIQLWRSNGVQLQNVDPVAFFVMIRFMYTGRVRLTIDTATQLLVTAQRFEVLPLVQLCRSFIARVALGNPRADGVNSGGEVPSQAPGAKTGAGSEMEVDIIVAA